MKKMIFFLFLIMLFPASPLFAGGIPAGSVKNVQGTVTVEREGTAIPAEKGMKIYARDLIVTGADGAVGVILQDNTIFSLGADSKLVLEEYVFSPDEGRFSLFAKMIKGTFVYLSGVMGKLSPESIKLETPVGTIAIRGTRFAAKIAGK
ncbi:MAG: FecR domain-containing protein [Pseudomonadota bacterium]